MKGIRSIVLLSTVAFVGRTRAIPQQPVAPPPKPADSGPNLFDTMKFLYGKLNDLGKVSFILFIHNTTSGEDFNNQIVDEFTNVIPNPSTCRIAYHEKVTRDGVVGYDGDLAFSLREAEDVVVKPFEQLKNEFSAAAGAPNLIAQPTNPPLAALIVRRPHGKFNAFYLTDAQLADRVAKAMSHAIELCGGGSKDPF